MHFRGFGVLRLPCSYLIYSQPLDALPETAMRCVCGRLLGILSGRDPSAAFQSPTAADRRAIPEILLDTKPRLACEWQDCARQQHLRLANAR